MILTARHCEKCGKPDVARPGGCLSYRYYDNGWKRGYFHHTCFRAKQRAEKEKLMRGDVKAR